MICLKMKDTIMSIYAEECIKVFKNRRNKCLDREIEREKEAMTKPQKVLLEKGTQRRRK